MEGESLRGGSSSCNNTKNHAASHLPEQESQRLPSAFRYKVIGAKQCTITTSCAQSVLPTSAKNFKEGSVFWPHVLAWFSAKREDCKFRETHWRRQQTATK